jgi:D-sedoheptulose 7-phosphate isomerase
MNIEQRLIKNLQASIDAMQILIANKETLKIFSSAVEMVVNQYRQGGRIYIAGNGGSAAEAQHLAAEFVSKLATDRAPLAAEALTVDTSILTAIGNDYGFEKIFSRQIEGKLTNKDIFLGLSTSGMSNNIILALKQCKAMNIPSVVFCGNNGGEVKELANYCIIAPGAATSTIQELHLVLAHTLCESVEDNIFKNQ